LALEVIGALMFTLISTCTAGCNWVVRCPTYGPPGFLTPKDLSPETDLSVRANFFLTPSS